MGKNNKNKYYAWTLPNGNSGVCDSWEECKAAIDGYRGVKYQSFKSYVEACTFANLDVPQPPVTLPSSNIPNEQAVQRNYTFTNDCSGSDEGSIADATTQYCIKYKFDNLSNIQKSAVQSVDGKFLLFAVPGSGKTTVLIARTGYMVFSRGIKPSEIMSLTFTRAAADEMRSRFTSHFDTCVSPDFRTIHSLCYSIILPMLKNCGYKFPENLIGQDSDEEDEPKSKYQAVSIFRELVKWLGVGSSDFDSTMEALQTVITGIKNTMMSGSEYLHRTIRVEGKDILICDIFDNYQNILRERNCLDYDDLLLYALDGLKSNPEVLTRIRSRYKYWSVDEAQDNSLLQFKLLDSIIGEDGNVFMVGDDDQSIYSFRGADPKLLIAYGNRTDVKTLVMGVNYRSDSDIVNTSKAFIETNTNRASKAMRSDSKEHGKIIIPKVLPTESSQYAYVLDAAKSAEKNGGTLAILYRRNISCLPLIIYMHKNKISYESSEGLSEILKSKHIRILWKLMYFSLHRSDLKVFSAINDFMAIHLSKDEKKLLEEKHKDAPDKDLLSLILEEYQLHNSEGENEKKIEDIKDTIAILDMVSIMSPSNAVITIIDKIYYCSLSTTSERLRIYSFLSACDLYQTISEFMYALEDIIQEEHTKCDEVDPTDFDRSIDRVSTSSKPAVTLSSMHAAKGREFDRVIIVDSFDEIMPGNPREDALIYDPEEEKRLFYVAATRAAHRLDILTIEQYHGNPELISRFVAEIAYICDSVCPDINVITDSEIPLDYTSSIISIEPQKFYAVKVGRIPGVYTSWEKCQEQVSTFPGADFQSFETRKEAKEYAAVNLSNAPVALNLAVIDRLLIKSGGTTINYPVDLPEYVTSPILGHLNVTHIKEISKDKLERLKSLSTPFGNSKTTDYSYRAESYMLTYMPVNFFKVWKPLRDLAEYGKMPLNCEVLELGAGPGTATFGLISFYILLATSNPSLHFSVSITAIERESSFKTLFEKIAISVKRNLPENLKVQTSFVNADAFTILPQYEKKYNLLLESNMLNRDENSMSDSINGYVGILEKTLATNGYSILIEPGKRENETHLNVIANKASAYTKLVEPTILATDVSKISIYNEALDSGLRFSNKPYHWFSYMVLQNKECF